MLKAKDLRVWGKCFAGLVAGLVAFLSWQGGWPLFWSILRVGAAFLLLYLLWEGSLYLFEKTALQKNLEFADQKEEISQENEIFSDDQGVDADVSEEEQHSTEKKNRLDAGSQKVPGQVQTHLTEGLSDPENQAEVVRRMGWGDRR